MLVREPAIAVEVEPFLLPLAFASDNVSSANK
jgi:hypothetical protein